MFHQKNQTLFSLTFRPVGVFFHQASCNVGNLVNPLSPVPEHLRGFASVMSERNKCIQDMWSNNCVFSYSSWKSSSAANEKLKQTPKREELLSNSFTSVKWLVKSECNNPQSEYFTKLLYWFVFGLCFPAVLVINIRFLFTSPQPTFPPSQEMFY